MTWHCLPCVGIQKKDVQCTSFFSLCIPFATQIRFHLLQQRLQFPAPDAQGHAGGQDVDDGEVQQAGDHGAVAGTTL